MSRRSHGRRRRDLQTSFQALAVDAVEVREARKELLREMSIVSDVELAMFATDPADRKAMATNIRVARIVPSMPLDIEVTAALAVQADRWQRALDAVEASA